MISPMKKIFILTILLLLIVHARPTISAESGGPDNIYHTNNVNFPGQVRLWESIIPHILEYCMNDISSPVIINNRQAGKYFSFESSQLQHISFGIGHLRYSLVHGISRASGYAFHRDKNMDYTGENVRFVLMHNPEDMAVLEKGFKKLFGIELLSKKIYTAAGRDIPDPPAFYKKIRDICFYFYNPNAIEKGFLSLYVKPGTVLFRHKTETLYNALFKNYFRELSYITALLLTDTAFITERAGEYVKEYQHNPDFNAAGFSWESARYILNRSTGHRLFVIFKKL